MSDRLASWYQFQALGLGEVDGKALFALQHFRATCFRESHEIADVVALQRLDLDHARTQVAEVPGADRGCHRLLDSHHEHIPQRQQRGPSVARSVSVPARFAALREC